MGCNSSIQVATSNITEEKPNSNLIKEEKEKIEECKSNKIGKQDNISNDSILIKQMNAESLTTGLNDAQNIKSEKSLVEERIEQDLKNFLQDEDLNNREKSFVAIEPPCERIRSQNLIERVISKESIKKEKSFVDRKKAEKIESSKTSIERTNSTVQEPVKREKSSVEIQSPREHIGSSDLIEREISKESINIEKRKAEIINVSDKTIESINVKQQQKRTSCPKLLEQKSFEEKTECIKIENAQNKSIQNQIMDSAPSDNSILLEKHESEAKIYHIDREKSILKEQSDCKTGLERNENKLNQIDREKSLVKKQLSSENLKLIDTNVFLKDSLENSYHINENNILKPEMKAENSEIDSNFINEEKPVEILKQQYQFELNSDLELSKELS